MNRKERIDLLQMPPETSDDRILEKAYTIPWFASDYDKDEESPPVKHNPPYAEEQQSHDAE